MAKLSLDKSEYENGLNESKSSATKFAQTVGKGLAAVGKATLTGVTVTAAGVTKITKDAIASFSDYEQLAGGAKLLWGGAYDFIAGKASEAYKNVQMSQNDYLQQVNGFSTGLKESLGGNEKAAAELADKIITAEADIVSATGVSQEAVQNAFNGIMKSNYTMLDNLQLGIKPTKEGMQEIIDKMNELNGTKYEMDNLADMQAALVDYVKYVGMAGYAHNEAADTIQGSLAMTKAAWSNLLTGLANDEADFGKLIDDLVESVGATADNIIPRVEIALNGVSDLIVKLAPIIADKLPALVEDIMPDLLNAATTVFMSLLVALPDLVKSLFDQLPTIIDSMIPSLIDTCLTLIDTLVTIMVDNAPAILTAAVALIVQLSQGLTQALPELIPTIVDLVLNLTMMLLDNAPLLIECAFSLMGALIDGIVNSIPTLVEKAPMIIVQFVDAFIGAFPIMLSALWDCLVNLGTMVDEWSGGFFSDAIAKIQEFLKNPPYYIGLAIGEIIAKLAELGQTIITNLTTFFTSTIPSKWESFKSWVSNLPQQLADFFRDLPQKFSDIGHNVVDGLLNGIKEKWENLKATVKGMFDNLVSGIKDGLKIHSPSKVFAGIGQFMAEGLDEGWSDEFADVHKNITGDLNFNAEPVQVSSTANTGSEAKIISWLEQNLPTLLNQSIVLDTGVLVGQTVGAMDDALGKRMQMNARYA